MLILLRGRIVHRSAGVVLDVFKDLISQHRCCEGSSDLTAGHSWRGELTSDLWIFM